jgi:hypothetical protein
MMIGDDHHATRGGGQMVWRRSLLSVPGSNLRMVEKAFASDADAIILDLDTPYFYSDLIEVVEGSGENLDAVLIPKVERPEDLYAVAALLNQLELATGLERRRIGIQAQVESTAGLECRVGEESGSRLRGGQRGREWRGQPRRSDGGRRVDQDGP